MTRNCCFRHFALIYIGKHDQMFQRQTKGLLVNVQHRGPFCQLILNSCIKTCAPKTRSSQGTTLRLREKEQQVSQPTCLVVSSLPERNTENGSHEPERGHFVGDRLTACFSMSKWMCPCPGESRDPLGPQRFVATQIRLGSLGKFLHAFQAAKQLKCSSQTGISTICRNKFLQAGHKFGHCLFPSINSVCVCVPISNYPAL